MNRDELYRQVARLHMQSLDQGFLGTLGERFLILMYEAIDSSEQGTLLVEAEGGQVQGFVTGGTGMGALYRWMLRRPVRLSLALAPALLSASKVRRILEILRYARGHVLPEGLPDAELLTIAVSPHCRGRGVANRLYVKLANEFRSRGVERFRIAVGEELEPAHRFYRRMGAEVVGSMELHGGARSLLYVHEI